MKEKNNSLKRKNIIVQNLVQIVEIGQKTNMKKLELKEVTLLKNFGKMRNMLKILSIKPLI